MENFRERILQCVSKIPKGKVVSYGQVAAICGSPRAARQVGQVLRNLDNLHVPHVDTHSLPKKPRKGIGKAGGKGKAFVGFPSQLVPWWRVVNSHGYLSINGNWDATKETQCSLLMKEGVEVSEAFVVDMGRFGWGKR